MVSREAKSSGEILRSASGIADECQYTRLGLLNILPLLVKSGTDCLKPVATSYNKIDFADD
jgi:hypothetical protein